MRDVVSNAFYLAHETLDVIQHAVDEIDEPVHVAGAASGRKSLTQVARHDPVNSAGDTADLAYRSQPGKHGARDTDRKHHDAAPGHRIQQKVFEATDLVDVVAQ